MLFARLATDTLSSLPLWLTHTHTHTHTQIQQHAQNHVAQEPLWHPRRKRGTPSHKAILLKPISQAKPKGVKTIYDYTVKNIKEEPFNLADLKGKVVLIVNVASQCGFTPQYKGTLLHSNCSP